MSISQMKKILIASYKDQAGKLLEAIQQHGIMELLDSGRSVVAKEWPELESVWERPRQIEEKLDKLERAIAFLKEYAEKKGGLVAALAPKTVIERKMFSGVVSGGEANKKLEDALNIEKKIETLSTEAENIAAQIQSLLPWENMQTPVEEIDSLDKATVLAGFLSEKNYNETLTNLSKLAVFEKISQTGSTVAFYAIAFNENTQEVQKFLRNLEFEAANFTGLKGTANELIKNFNAKLAEIQNELVQARKDAKEISGSLLDLEIMADYYRNALSKHKAQMTSPQSEKVFLFEGWVKKKDFAELKKIVSRFDASSITEIPVRKDEDVPVEIDNPKFLKPFETVTRLYGMPQSTSVDPTAFLAPFFAIFLGLCMSDVGYGLILAVIFWWLGKKLQACKQAIMLFFICSFTTILAGLITGSWFADTITSLIPQDTKVFTVLNGIKDKFLLIDPIAQPINFIILTLAIGYFQMMFGFCIAMVRNLLQKNFVAAICDQLVWLVFFNNFLVIGIIKFGKLPASLMPVSVAVAIICAITILLFAVREGSWGSRIGMGAFQLFSAVFFVGDTLSYCRLMALAMVGAGFGMAINVLVKMLMDVPYVGFIAGAILFVVGHTFNIALSLLGAFVHSMRLQFIEFFPKFFSGGGTDFRPLTKEYKHIMIKE
ncbi:MAG: V-type ATP synthase subunit I [Planctomycetaceae bacterium]|nr:V-type ATP synthase subunit I [Planctomycetaceae bacterium]